MIDLVLVAVFSGSSPVFGAGSFPPSPPPPPVQTVDLISASPPAPAPVVSSTPAPKPQAQQQEPPQESWAEKMWKRYNQNKGGH